MRRLFAHRIGHYLLLVAVSVGVLFPNLGATALWDDDEGVNAECAREMREAGTWVVPTFNWELRTAKPVFLYWLMRFSYAAFGETEWAARLPSALLTIGTVLLVYELGRRMFDATTGLLAGVITVTSLEVCKLGHAATPDATLLFFTVLYFLCFWAGTANGGRGWFVPCGIASGFAFLTKGPVGLVLPSAVVIGWFAWNREWWRWWDRRLIWGGLAWAAVAIPWYALVAAETRGEWPRTFFLKENLGRSAEPMENHRGPVVYYLAVVCLMFAPWSAFLWATIRSSLVPLSPGARGLAWNPSPLGERSRGEGESESVTEGTNMGLISPESPSPPTPLPQGRGEQASRFLFLWIAVYFLAFSVVATKLPHYIAPTYPALALLTARLLVRWMRDEAVTARWVLPAGIVGVGFTGLAVGVAFLIGGGAIPLPASTEKLRLFPGLESWAWIGGIPILGAVAMAVYLRRGNRPAVVLSLAASTVAFVGLVAAFPLGVVDQYKAAKELVAKSGARQLDRDVRIGSLEFSQPSLTFYVGRRVERVNLTPDIPPEDRDRHLAGLVAGILSAPGPAFVFVPEPTWRRLEPIVMFGTVAASQYDFTRHAVIVTVWNGR